MTSEDRRVHFAVAGPLISARVITERTDQRAVLADAYALDSHNVLHHS